MRSTNGQVARFRQCNSDISSIEIIELFELYKDFELIELFKVFELFKLFQLFDIKLLLTMILFCNIFIALL